MAHLYRHRGYQVKAFERVYGNIVGKPEEWSVEVFNVTKPLRVGTDEHILKNQENQLLNFHTWRPKIGIAPRGRH
jgi:hypothetical protein